MILTGSLALFPSMRYFSHKTWWPLVHHVFCFLCFTLLVKGLLHNWVKTFKAFLLFVFFFYIHKEGCVFETVQKYTNAERECNPVLGGMKSTRSLLAFLNYILSDIKNLLLPDGQMRKCEHNHTR